MSKEYSQLCTKYFGAATCSDVTSKQQQSNQGFTDFRQSLEEYLQGTS